MKYAALSFLVFAAAALSSCAGGSNSSSSTANNSQTATTTAAPANSVAFTDINGYDGAQQVNDLAALGVFDQTGGAFRPNDPITRADFVRWLVKANNAIVKDSQYHIRPAQGGAATFVDVPSSSSDFKYIQGLANAGYVIGVDATHFAPAKALTREQMVYVKASVDEHQTIKTSGSGQRAELSYADKGKILEKYVGAVYEDTSASTTGNFKRVYGSVSLFQPQAAVTRGDAAIALSVMKGEWDVSAAAALGRTPYP